MLGCKKVGNKKIWLNGLLILLSLGLILPASVFAEGERIQKPLYAPRPKTVKSKPVKQTAQPEIVKPDPSNPEALNPTAPERALENLLPTPGPTTPPPLAATVLDLIFPDDEKNRPSINNQVTLGSSVTNTAAQRQEIILKCDTVVYRGKKAVSIGAFYIDLFPSDVFAETQADFRIFSQDPRHDSLMRQSSCLDRLCSAQATEGAYYLVSLSDKKGYLRITLDRRSGAYSAEAYEKGRLGLGAQARSETGTCVPVAKPKAMF